MHLGRVIARLVFKHCFRTHEQEPTAKVSIPLLYTPCFGNDDDMFYAMDGVHPSYHLMKGRDKKASECFRLNMAILRALTKYAIDNVHTQDTLTAEQAAKVREYNKVVNLLKTINVDKENVLHFRASCLHTTNVAHVEKVHLFMQDNNIFIFNVFLHLAFSETFILVCDDDLMKIMKRLRDDDIPDAAMKAGGFWAKLLVSNAD